MSLPQAAGAVLDVHRCNRCGFCQEVCPTYNITGRETDVARGRNRLLRLAADDRLALHADREVKQHLYSCLLCGACAAVCPPGVATDRLILAARAQLASKTGQPFLVKSALRGILASPARLALLAGSVRLYETSGCRRLLRSSGLFRVWKALGRLDTAIPAPPRSSLRNELRRRKLTAPGPGRAKRRRVAYFLGCVTDNFLPAVGEAVIAVLERNGYDVVVPENVCCGLPHRAYGDTEKARQLARVNTSLLMASGAEAIVSDCASCLRSLKDYPDLLGSGREAENAAGFSSLVRDVTQFLVEEGLEPPRAALRGVVTYHDPCHLSRGLGVRRQPRELLASLPGLEYREMEEADWCCGGAGSYSLTHPHLSELIVDRKMSHVRRTGADVLATSCPSCLLQLGWGVRRAALPVRLAHPLQLLWQSYAAPQVVGQSLAAETTS